MARVGFAREEMSRPHAASASDFALSQGRGFACLLPYLERAAMASGLGCGADGSSRGPGSFLRCPSTEGWGSVSGLKVLGSRARRAEISARGPIRSLVVDNRPGAAGLIAADAVLRAPPDGNTLLFTSPDPLVVTPHFKVGI
jgi:hypothetical protein